MNDYCGSRCQIHNIGVTGEGRTLKVIQIGNHNRSSNRGAIWIEAGIHGREWISPVTSTNIIHKVSFVSYHHILVLLLKSRKRFQWLILLCALIISDALCDALLFQLIRSSDRCDREASNSLVWYILPVANPDGYEYSKVRVSSMSNNIFSVCERLDVCIEVSSGQHLLYATVMRLLKRNMRMTCGLGEY